MDLLKNEREASTETESVRMINAITLGKAYWDDPSKSFGLLTNAMEKIPVTTTLTFLRLTQRLAKTKRAGWVSRGISPAEVESVAAHSWRMAIICFVLVPSVSNATKLANFFYC
jgi:hypothetical protein